MRQVEEVLSGSSAARLSITASVLALVCAACFPWAHRRGPLEPPVVGAAAFALGLSAASPGAAARSVPLVVAGVLGTSLLPVVRVIATLAGEP
ncbi:hypothetical protein [Kineococcus sp. SYSU DK002]|uniref:hypothetical protein n=1 Tax=Kineococcus sp. SYSU DK002 TaxID=3383123 RepID=UPI003D7CF43E